MNRKVLIGLCLFVLSRIYFINTLPVFFDSPEYLERFLNPNYLRAIASGHSPFHAGYFILFWPIFQLAKLIGMNPPLGVIFAQIIFSLISLYCLYRFVNMILDKRTAVISTIICSLMPIYWITNVSIMVESTYVNLFFISIFILLYRKTISLS